MLTFFILSAPERPKTLFGGKQAGLKDTVKQSEYLKVRTALGYQN